ncbi:hypothetical protein AB0N38_10610 [Micromonospora aurantiaca]|uniref:hypothetical protein n=1 Tax=Micromonospora aurantiaca (nom. illeg.) TaxID=47850 RepID=UPI00342CA270
MAEPIRCPYCRQRHMPRYLCDPAKRVLDEMQARGASYIMPTLELPDPIPAAQLGLGFGPDDQLVSQLVVQAATIPHAGIQHPALILTGRSPYGQLPYWLYAAGDTELRATADLVRDMAELAIQRAG